MDTTGKSIVEKYLEMKMNNRYINRIIKSGNNCRPKYAMRKILLADCGGTKIHKNECMKREQKLILTSGGDWEMQAVMVKSSHFSNQKDFDEIMLEKSHSSFEHAKPKMFSNISFVKEFQLMHMKKTVDTMTVLSSASEEQRDKYELNVWQYGKEKTEKRLLNSLLLQLFGSPSRLDAVDYKGYEGGFKELTIYDFYWYYEGGNGSHGTARHGDYYLYFGYSTS